MSKSLIRKNQLHPDIKDLVNQYGSEFFVDSGEFNAFTGSNLISPYPIVYQTGNQTISGIKNFISRPTINGTGVLLSGEAVAGSISDVVYTTGDQTVDGSKTFIQNVYLESGLRFNSFYSPNDVEIDLLSRPYYNTRVSIGTETGILGESINSQNNHREIKIWETGGLYTNFSYGPFIRIGATGTIIAEQIGTRLGIGTVFPQEKVHISGGNLRVDGNTYFLNRPTVNGTGVLLSGEAAQVDLSSTVRTTGNQTISGTKTFVTNSLLYSGVNVNFDSNTNVKFSGQVSFSNDRSWTTGISLGNSSYTIPYYGGSFSTTPTVLTTLEVTGSTVFNHNIKNRTTSQFTLLFPSTLTENVTLNVRAVL